MTNAEIITRTQFELAEQGKLKMIGDFPEPIHTFTKWKELGYSVKKGETSNIKIPIWKSRTKTVTDNETGEAKESTSMFMKTAAFFTFAQVEPIKATE